MWARGGKMKALCFISVSVLFVCFLKAWNLLCSFNSVFINLSIINVCRFCSFLFTAILHSIVLIYHNALISSPSYGHLIFYN